MGFKLFNKGLRSNHDKGETMKVFAAVLWLMLGGRGGGSIICPPEDLGKKLKNSDVVFDGFVEKREVLKTTPGVFGVHQFVKYTFVVYTGFKGVSLGRVFLYDVAPPQEGFQFETRYLVFATKYDRESEMMRRNGWDKLASGDILIPSQCRTGMVGKYSEAHVIELTKLAPRTP